MSTPNQIEHALLMFTRTFHPYKHQSFLNINSFSDGLPFAYILASVQFFAQITDQLDLNPDKWTQKLVNLKKIISQMEKYMTANTQKLLKINDIQLVEIAKNNSQQETLRFFQTLIAVLMQTPQKQDYIQKIMGLDERSQQALVFVVQNALQQRVSEQFFQSNVTEHLEYRNLQNQNYILSQQIDQITKQNQSLMKKNATLLQKIQDYQEEIEKATNLNIQICINNQNRASQIEIQNSLIGNLKKKIIDLTRQHEMEITQLKDQIYDLRCKLSNSKHIEQELFQRNRILEKKMISFTQSLDTQYKKSHKALEEKDLRIKRLEHEIQILRNKIHQLSVQFQVNDLNLKIQLEKKQVRFKKLQKQVKNRSFATQSSQLNTNTSLNIKLQRKQVEQKDQELEYLNIQIQKLRNINRQLQRENLKLKKKSQKVQTIENQKKKLEKIILDVSKSRDAEIQMLLVSLYDLRNQNIRMHQIINQLKERNHKS